MRRFEPDRYYLTSDPELALIATRGTLAQWRHRAVGPRYLKYGNRVVYLGADLNAWLDAHIVDPRPPFTVEQRSGRSGEDAHPVTTRTESVRTPGSRTIPHALNAQTAPSTQKPRAGGGR